MSKGKQNIDLIAAVFMLAVSAIFGLQLRKVSNELDLIFPQFIIICLVILSVILLVKAFIKPDRKNIFDIKNRGRVVIGVIASIIWVSLVRVIGFGVTSVVIFSVLSWLLAEKSKRNAKTAVSSVLVGIVVIAVIYFIFSKFLEVPLPKGILI